MYIFWMILYSLAISGLEIIMFFKVDGISLTFDRIFKAFLLKFLLAAIVTTFKFLVLTDYLSYFIEPLFGISLSLILLRGLPKKLLFFPNGGSCLIARYKVREVSEAINNLH